MKPSPFRYLKPASLEETLAYLDQYGSECALLAGGQSLVPMMNFRLARPEVLVDLNGLDELRRIEVDDLGVTIGGSVAHADPAAEYPTVLVALAGSVVLTSRFGSREVPAEAFFRGPFVTALAPGELCTALRLPSQPWARRGVAFLEVTRRHRGVALAGAAAEVWIGADGTIEEARLALAGVGPCPVRVEAAAGLRGQLPVEKVFEELAREVRRTVEPHDDVHGSAEFRRHLAGILAARALRRATNRALDEEEGS